jgi:hypothetical protein
MGADKEGYWSKVRSDAAERRANGKRGGGQSLDGKSLDVERLRGRIRDWRAENNLKTDNIATSIDRHDASHVLIKDYLGKSSEQIARLVGLSGKGPSILEEILADVMDSYPSSGKVERSDLLSKIKRSIKYTVGQDYDIAYEGGGTHLSPRTLSTIAKYFMAMSERSDFGKFIETLHHAQDFVASDKYRI